MFQETFEEIAANLLPITDLFLRSGVKSPMKLTPWKMNSREGSELYLIIHKSPLNYRLLLKSFINKDLHLLHRHHLVNLRGRLSLHQGRLSRLHQGPPKNPHALTMFPKFPLNDQ